MEALDRGLALVANCDPHGLAEQLKRVREQAATAPQTDRLAQVNPDVLAEFRAALALPFTSGRGEDEPEPYLPPLDRLIAAGLELNPALHAEIRARALEKNVQTAAEGLRALKANQLSPRESPVRNPPGQPLPSAPTSPSKETVLQKRQPGGGTDKSGRKTGRRRKKKR